MVMKSTVGQLEQEPTRPLGAAVSMKEEQALEAWKLTLGKVSVLDSVEEEPTTATAVMKDVPHSIKSVNELFGLSAALSIFTRRFKELENHLESIDKSIDNMPKQQNVKKSEVLVVVSKSKASTSSSLGAPILSSAEQTTGNSANDKTCKETSHSSLENLCETMGSRGLRKHVTLHLSDIEKLREDVTTAIKRAPNPGKLVLDCIGRFYLQGSKAYNKDSPMIINRKASLLILEFFLLSGCTNIEPSVKGEAEQAAIAWRKRLISEGGVANASNADARGLLLFVASFGIPSDFKNQDLSELICLSNAREVSNALQQSSSLIKRIPDIIQGMMQRGMWVAAVDAAYSFGVEEKFPPEPLLTLFLHQSEETWKGAKRRSQGSPVTLKEASEKHLVAFKNVMKCLGDYKIDPMKLAGWNIVDKIANLEKEISDLERVIAEKGVLKRKADEVKSLKFKSEEVKHMRTSNGVSPQLHSNVMLSQEQRAFGRTDGQTFYNGGLSGQPNGYSGGAAGAGALYRNIPGNVAGANVGHAAGVGGALHADALVHLAHHGAGSYAWHGDGALNDNSLRQNFMGPPTFPGRGLFGSASAMEQGFSGQSSTAMGLGNRNSGPDLYQFADTVFEGELYNTSSSHTGNFYMAPSTAHLHHQTHLQ